MNYENIYDKNFFLLLDEKFENALTKMPFTKEQFEHVRIFFDGAEYGLCFEELCAIIKNNKIPISESNYKDIEELGKTMLFEAKTWEGLRPLVK